MSEVRISLRGIEALRRDMPKLTDKIERDIAHEAPENIVKNILRRKTGIFPSASLPPNAPSTVRKKGHNQQLVDEGILTDESGWSIRKTNKGYIVRPPAERENASFFLHNGVRGGKKYKFMEIPAGFFPKWAALMVNAYFNKIIPRYS